MTNFLRQLASLSFVLFFLAACGGGGGGSNGTGAVPPVSTGPGTPPVTPVTPAAPPATTSISLQSDQGDWIGQGKAYQYTPANAIITVSASNNRLVIQVEGDEQWTGVVQTGGGATELKAGEYPALGIYREDMPASQGGLTWWGNGRSCTSSTGWAAIDSVSYANGQLQAISLRFQRNCNGATAALRGTINYAAADKTTAPLPSSVPGDLWRPPASVSASKGNYAYFESTPGDYVGLGKTWLFDRRSALVTVDGNSGYLGIQVAGDDVWRAEIVGVRSQGRLVPGYYPGVKGARFNNPLKGGMSWTGAGRGCSVSSGWFAVDAVEYENFGSVKRLDMRFEQHCEGRDAPLRGAIHYDSTPESTGNVNISAPGSWRAPAAALPASDNFLYLQSDPNEPLARGRTDLQTSANTAFEVTTTGNMVQVYGKGNHMWGVQFQAPAGMSQIVPGNYASVAAWPSSTSSDSVLYVTADGAGCNAQQGWVTVDSASYVNGKLAALEMRFEQQCSGGTGGPQGLLHGHLRWRADVPAAFPAPAAVPDLFWRPAATMPAGTYIYITSDRSDFVGNGDALFTPVNSAIDLTEKDGKVDIDVRGDTRWHASFQAIANAGAIQPGYYAGLEETPFRPARGSFSWSGDGRACNTASSGVVVDNAVYAGGKLTELSMRFEQHCENAPGALRGQIHWFASDMREPPGPQAIPGTLWKAPAGAVPSSGNYLYVESAPGEGIGAGRTYLLTTSNAALNLQSAASTPLIPGAFLTLRADSGNYASGQFNLEFQAMRSLAQFQPGLYDHLMRSGFHNTAFGGLSLSSFGAGCNTSIGWMALDKASYANGRLSAVHGRFEQYCDGNPVPLHGEFNWEG